MNEPTKSNGIFDEIATSLGVEATPLTPLVKKDLSKIEDDYEFARENIHKTIQHSQDAVSHLTELAIVTQDPEAYEALSKVVQTFVTANKQLIEMLELKQKIDMRGDKDSSKTVHNNLFISTSDLQKLIEQQRK